MITGLVLGPLSGWLRAGELIVFTQYPGTFALILILFEAGAEIRLREALRHFPAGLLFAILSFGASFAAAACVGRWLLGLAPHNSLLFGAVLGCVSGTIVIPPRGLVNAVLALQVAGRAPGMEFLPAMAFTLILVTNLLVVLATWRFRPPSN